MNFKGKNILVTGGDGFGVGAGVCKVLSDYGASLIINGRSKEKVEEALKLYPNAIPAIGDISKPSDVASLFAQLDKEVGTIHGLVNNAGVGLSKPSHEASEQEFDRLYSVDVRGLWMVSKHFVSQLLKRNTTGNIVNISSVHAHATIPRYAIYSSAKSAVEGLTRGMAVELGKYDIRVNAVAPGYVHAEQNFDLIRTWTDEPEKWVRDYVNDEQAIHREILPEDCGYPVAFLLSDLSRSITGQTLYVDSGDSIKLLGSLSV